MNAIHTKKELRRFSSLQKAKILQGFFKTGPGEYGEGDVFIGVKVPEIREVAEKFKDLPTTEIRKLLHSLIHEERLLALLILISQFEQGGDKTRQTTVAFYLRNIRFINNWDLVDLSAPKIIGAHLRNKNRILLYKLARSKNMWERRIAIVSTFAFIRENDLKDTFAIASMLLSNKEDLMHKAVGWMLREAGKRDVSALEIFLKERYKTMPRTMLRYAIERFPETKRQDYLKNRI